MIILTHVGSPVPKYADISIKQASQYEQVVFVTDDYDYKNENCEVIYSNNIQNKYRKEFEQICNWSKDGVPNTTHPSPPGFWRYATERLIVLCDFVQSYNIKEFVHFENDVMIYDNISNIKTVNGIFFTPLTKTDVTTGMMIYNKYDVDKLANHIISCIHDFNRGDIQKFGCMVNDMSILNLLDDKKLLPVVPTHYGFVFDSASYGQYLGGTNNGHSKGFMDHNHIISQFMITHNTFPFILDKKPYIRYDNINIPILSLHIHSKKLQDFTC